METFIGWVMGLSFCGSLLVTMMSGGAWMPLMVAAVLGVSTTVAASALAIINALKAGSTQK